MAITVGRDASSATELELGIFETILGEVDPMSLVRSLGATGRHLVVRPQTTVPALTRFGAGLGLAAVDVVTRTLTGRLEEPVPTERGDLRFRDPTWARNPVFRMILEAYLAAVRLSDELVAGAGLDDSTEPRAQFAARLVTDALAPTNALVTNPAALKRAFETGGASALRGARNLVTDVRENGGWPRQVDTSGFELGVNLAASPGKVVFRNELIEVLQYEACTPEVHEIPLLVCPPWINRYYIADLAPGKSLVEWAVRHGHSTFAISYRNPDASMRDLTFDDFVRLGPLTAIDVVRSIAGCDVTNIVSICLGGTLTTISLAYLEAVGDHLVNSSTLLNSAVDYADCGVLADVFANESTVDAMSRRMVDTGYLEAKEMTRTFSLLRANDLVFRYVVDGWLMGEDPPAFDLLAWNDDSTRMPGRTHAHFLRKMYGENAFAEGTLSVLEETLALSSITADHYVVAAIEDHIVPWQSSYRTTQLVKAPTRFVLTSAGHIAGIVNPPNPKARLWVNDGDTPTDPAAWLSSATQHPASWWEDWRQWLGEHAGELREPRAPGSAEHPPLADAPGEYVRS
jgi:polyhydroxyalkanoate synthase